MRDVTAVDPAKVAYKQMSIYDLSYETVGDEYDLVLLFRILNHLSNPLLALKMYGRFAGHILLLT